MSPEISDFRLLRAHALSKSGVPLGAIDFSTAVTSELSRIGIVLGANSLGKSRFLGALASAFRHLYQLLPDSGRSEKVVRNEFPFRLLEYALSGAVYTVRAEPSGLQLAINGRAADLNTIRLPKRVIASTLTPFDKFPKAYRLPRTLTSVREESKFYHYFGLQRANGVLSISAMVHDLLEHFIDVDDDHQGMTRARRLERVFAFLRYRPKLTFSYRLQVSLSKLAAIAKGERTLEEAFQGMRSSRIAALIRQREVTPFLEKQLALAFEQVAHNEALRNPTLEFRFDQDGFQCEGTVAPPIIRLLRNVGILRLTSAVVERVKDGMTFDLVGASSGELSILMSFVSIASAIDDASLVLIDEPEASLHPKWQNQYLDLLRECFTTAKGCQFVVATHSPLIVGDIPSQGGSVVRFDGNAGVLSSEELSGESADFVLMNAFQLNTRINYWLQMELANAIGLAGDGEIKSASFRASLDKLKSIVEVVGSDSPQGRVINTLAEAYTKIVEGDRSVGASD